MLNRRSLAVGALVALGTLAAPVVVAQQASPADQAITYRKSVYQVILWNLGPMGAMVQGRTPFDASTFARNAQRIATMAPMLSEAYVVESATPGKTRAKAEIWKNKADFDKLMQDFVTQTATFANVAKGGDLAKIRPAFGQMTQTCKACHDKYRSE